MIIYHGSVNILEKPQYGKGKDYNDYGKGFYCTESLELAKEWACTEKSNGYANKYELNLENLKVLDLRNKKYNVLHWITLLIKNRRFAITNEISKEGKEYLINNFLIDISEYDIIIGYRADDAYFTFAQNFLNNTISVQKLKEALLLGNLGEQIVLKSEQAFSRLKFLGYEIADQDIYYSLRKIRDDVARKKYYENRRGLREDDIYLVDIIMKGIKQNDSRL